MKIIFFGSDDFATAHLKALLESKHQVLCTVTGPDKPQGRGMKLVISPIKQLAQENRIPCLQPLTLKDPSVAESLKSYGADIFVVVAYGRLLTQQILDIPKIFCINVHGSLLPQYRGAAPVNWAILNGDNETGVTIQKMALELDAGEIIAQEKMMIPDDENAGQLRLRMSVIGAKLLIKLLDQSQFPLKAQDKNLVTYAPKLTKDMGKIDWNKPAASIHNQIRGLQPWPGAHTIYNGKLLKILKSKLTGHAKDKAQPGEIMKVDKNGFCVACAEGGLLITEVQPEAGKVMPASSFIAGHKVVTGTTFS